MKKAVIVLPTYNEKENIKILIPEIFDVTADVANWNVSILVADDSSPDNTAEVVQQLQKKYPTKLHLISGNKEGLGAAYQRAFRYAIDKLKPNYIFEMDADRQHDPKLIPQFLKKVDEGADFVIGSRYMKGGGIPRNWALYRKFFSFFGNIIFRLGFMKLSITEWTNGYRLIDANFLDKTLPLYKKLNGYTFQIGVLDNAVKNGLNIQEIPCRFEERGVGESKIKTFEFITNNLFYILFNSSFVKFVIVGLTGAIFDFGVSYILIDHLLVVVWLSTVISAEISIISNFILNNSWSFAHKRIDNSLPSLLRGFINFNAVSAGNIVIQAVLMSITTTIFPIQYWFIYKVLIIATVVIPYSYFMYNRFIWKSK